MTGSSQGREEERLISNSCNQQFISTRYIDIHASSTNKNVTNEVLEEFLLLPLYFVIVQYKISGLHL